MAISVVSVSAKLENGDSITPAPSGSDQMLISVGMGRSGNGGRTLTVHDLGAESYVTGFFEENSPDSTFTYTYGDFILDGNIPTISSTEDLTWSGAMVADGDGDSVLYIIDGADQSDAFTADAIEFESTTTPTAVTISPSSGDLILYWIAFSTGAIDADPSGFGSPDVTGEMAALSGGAWYSKISDGTETSVTATLTASASGTHAAGVQPAAAVAGNAIDSEPLDTVAINSTVIDSEPI